jgi:ubiquitin-like-conjugating enzyme ATG3
MASVHPCKHSSVMKKVIERMDLAVRKAQMAEQGGAGAQGAAEAKEGKEWGILSGKKKDGEASKEGAAAGQQQQDGPEGLRVDQYLVVFLKFMSSIG